MANNDPFFTGNQLDIFQQLETSPLEHENAPDLDLSTELRGAMNKALREGKGRGQSRDHIVDRMNLCLPKEHHITKRKLDAWLAKSKEDHNTPAAWLPAFCWATNSIYPFLVLLEPLGFDVADQRDRLVAELGQTLIKKSQATRQANQIRKFLESK